MNRAVFFDRVRAAPFRGSLTQQQVDGLGAILDAAAAYGLPDIRWLAYCLATAFLETARTMQPIKEMGGTAYFTRMYDIKGERPAKARELGNLTPGDGAKFCGRGYVQLTGRTNYERAGKKLGIDLVAVPGRAMEPDIAAEIMFAGMTEGWFTGKKLADYFAPSKSDAVNARRIINGTDRAKDISDYYEAFLAALKASGWLPADASRVLPTPADTPDMGIPIAPQPDPITPPPAAEPALSFWARLLAALFGK